ncbi:hypothetical protein XB02_19585 [Pantoea ananatis]|nr:hypothetical protein XB02_19585 [Pantoea ananatis]
MLNEKMSMNARLKFPEEFLACPLRYSGTGDIGLYFNHICLFIIVKSIVMALKGLNQETVS